jgi:hypothetical protein
MEHLTPEEQRTRKAYRWVLLGGLIVVVALALWLVKPPEAIDLRFLSVLKPTIDPREDSSYANLTFPKPSADVAKLLDSHLTVGGHWRKSTRATGKGQFGYDQPGLQGASITLVPNGPKSSVLWISAPRSPVLLPK